MDLPVFASNTTGSVVQGAPSLLSSEPSMRSTSDNVSGDDATHAALMALVRNASESSQGGPETDDFLGRLYTADSSSRRDEDVTWEALRQLLSQARDRPSVGEYINSAFISAYECLTQQIQSKGALADADSALAERITELENHTGEELDEILSAFKLDRDRTHFRLTDKIEKLEEAAEKMAEDVRAYAKEQEQFSRDIPLALKDLKAAAKSSRTMNIEERSALQFVTGQLSALKKALDANSAGDLQLRTQVDRMKAHLEADQKRRAKAEAKAEAALAKKKGKKVKSKGHRQALDMLHQKVDRLAADALAQEHKHEEIIAQREHHVEELEAEAAAAAELAASQEGQVDGGDADQPLVEVLEANDVEPVDLVPSPKAENVPRVKHSAPTPTALELVPTPAPEKALKPAPVPVPVPVSESKPVLKAPVPVPEPTSAEVLAAEFEVAPVQAPIVAPEPVQKPAPPVAVASSKAPEPRAAKVPAAAIPVAKAKKKAPPPAKKTRKPARKALALKSAEVVEEISESEESEEEEIDDHVEEEEEDEEEHEEEEEEEELSDDDDHDDESTLLSLASTQVEEVVETKAPTAVLPAPAPAAEAPSVRIPQVSRGSSATRQPSPHAVKREEIKALPPSEVEEIPSAQLEEVTAKATPAAAMPPVVEALPIVAEKNRDTLSQVVEDRRNATNTPVVKPGGPKKKHKWRKLTSRWLQESPRLTAFLNHLQEVEAEQASLQSTLTTAQLQMAAWIEVLDEDQRKGVAWDEAANEMEELLQAFERDKAASQELHEQHERVVILEQAKRDKDLKAGLTMQQLGARLPTVERAVADLRSLSVLEQQINAMFENKADAVVFQAQLAALNHDLRIGLDLGREEDATYVQKGLSNAATEQARADKAMHKLSTTARIIIEQLDAVLKPVEAALNDGKIAEMCRESCAKAVDALAAQQQKQVVAQWAATAELSAQMAKQMPSEGAVQAIVQGCVEEAVVLRNAQVERLHALAVDLQSDLRGALRREDCPPLVEGEVTRLLASQQHAHSVWSLKNLPSNGQNREGGGTGRDKGSGLGQGREGQNSGNGGDFLDSARTDDSAASSVDSNWVSASGLRGGRLAAPPQQSALLR